MISLFSSNIELGSGTKVSGIGNGEVLINRKLFYNEPNV